MEQNVAAQNSGIGLMNIQSIVIIGAGNMAWHLGHALKIAGLEIKQVFSRKLEKAIQLADSLDGQAINDLQSIDQHSDLYIIAVSDQAIAAVSQQLVLRLSPNVMIVHTSGATPSTIFDAHFLRKGIFYPLQSLSKDKKTDFTKVPICVHANLQEDAENLYQLGRRISHQVAYIDDQQRAVLHIAAVFVNNFSNYLFHVGSEITKDANVPFELLLPLIQETVQKIKDQPPQKMQTGPAIRDDQNTIDRHLAFLENYPSFAEVYQLISRLIPNMNSK